jgi:hypothetical protein
MVPRSMTTFSASLQWNEGVERGAERGRGTNWRVRRGGGRKPPLCHNLTNNSALLGLQLLDVAGQIRNALLDLGLVTLADA